MHNFSYQFLGACHDFSKRKETDNFFGKKIIQPVQSHGKTVSEVTHETKNSTIFADGVWTKQKNITLSIKTADCMAVLFYQPDLNIIGAIHAGWRGLAQKICTEFLENFTHAERKKMQVFISPSLQKCCSEFSDPYNETPHFFHNCIEKRNNKYFIDLSKVLEKELMEKGISRENISNKKICTKCSEGKWWSHRNNNTERNLSIITLE